MNGKNGTTGNPKSAKENQSWKVNSVVNALRVLKCFTEASPDWTLSQLAQSLQMPKSTLLNMLRTLEMFGIIRKSESNQSYHLGLELLEMGYSVRKALPIIQYAIPLMEEVQEKTNKIIYFTIPKKGKVLYLEGIYPTKRTVSYSVTGKTLPMHCTGCGKAMLSQMTEEDVQKIIDCYGLPRLTQETITDYDTLMQTLCQDRERGYSIDRGEETPGVKCVAVAIKGREQVLGAISISGSTMSMQDEDLPVYAEMLANVTHLLAMKADAFPDCPALP